MFKLRKALERAMRSHLAGRPGPVPDGGGIAWRWFADLNRTRTHHASGPNPISFAEIDAYARLYRWSLEPRHVDLLLALDRVWIDDARQKQSTGGFAPLPKMSNQPLTTEAFDAVFG